MSSEKSVMPSKNLGMSSKKWVLTFLISLLLLVVCIMGFNFATDPFGVFKDRIFSWYSFNFTNNPSAAKIAWLDENHEKYDSYIIGSSGASSYPVETLDQYTGDHFFNLFSYGADMEKSYLNIKYVIEHYQVKNIVLNVGIMDAINFNLQTDDITRLPSAKVTGASRTSFYKTFLLANPLYGFNKIRDFKKNTYLPESFDVFHVDTGAYDKSVRDTEHISDLISYAEQNSAFQEMPTAVIRLGSIDNSVRRMADIKALCDENHVDLKVVFMPLYYPQYALVDKGDLVDFQVKIAQITDFWDFSVSSVSMDPRYFYDVSHFRNAVGNMALARMYQDDSVYLPDDFGFYVTADNAKTHTEQFYREPTLLDQAFYQSYSKEVPILMYHHIAEDGDGDTIMSSRDFENHIKALVDAGYQGVSMEELIRYVREGAPLPEKPVVITFDDGYLSNYEKAYPILKKYGMKATIFVIGMSIGKDVYKDTDNPITPHFSYEQAKEMEDSGLISIQSHTYDMHQWEPFETGETRDGALPMEGESENAYIQAFQSDCLRFESEMKNGMGATPCALAYPHGKYTKLTEVLLNEMGIRITLTTESGTNTLIKGLPQSLYAMKRYKMDNGVTPAELLDTISK